MDVNQCWSNLGRHEPRYLQSYSQNMVAKLGRYDSIPVIAGVNEAGFLVRESAPFQDLYHVIMLQESSFLQND